ncbi:MAG: class I SAM-dependent methyltransferase [Thermacetogeniaceae bacterium]
MSESHRNYFNEKAAVWDSLIDEVTVSRLARIVEKLGIKAGSTVLDAGSGTGVLIPFLRQAVGREGRIVALDFAEEMLRRAREKHGDENITYIVGDLARTPFLDCVFDEIICNSCFPHLQDKPAAAKEMLRILKPGGRVTVCHTMGREMVNALHRSLGGVVGNDLLPDEAEARRIFEEAGFICVEISDSPEEYLLTAYKPPAA